MVVVEVEEIFAGSKCFADGNFAEIVACSCAFDAVVARRWRIYYQSSWGRSKRLCHIHGVDSDSVANKRAAVEVEVLAQPDNMDMSVAYCYWVNMHNQTHLWCVAQYTEIADNHNSKSFPLN